MQAANKSSRELKATVSLRLPPALVDIVEQHAKEHRISKTEAFLHFLSRGIEADRDDETASTLARIEQTVSETLRLVREQKNIASGKEAVVDSIRMICREYPAILRAYLFGSFARETFDDESDIDIRLEVDKNNRFSLRDLEQFSRRIEEMTGRAVDAITAHQIKNKALREAIERDKELVYERKAE